MKTSRQQKLAHSARRGFTRVEAIVVLTVVVISMTLVIPFLGKSSGHHPETYNASQMRGIHQSMIIWAQNNNTYLPGLDSYGNILAADDSAYSGVPQNSLTGGSMAGRYYILLNGSFIIPDSMIHPHEALTKWKSPNAMPTASQFSYALLRIATGPTATEIGNQAGRAIEWRDNANDQSILISDRNTAAQADPGSVRSAWSKTSGNKADWKGTVVWGDNHSEFLFAKNGRLGPLSLNTKYGATINTNDFLFSEQDMPGKVGSASAMFGYTHDNF